MKYVNLGTTGMKVSPFCLGTMQFGWTADEKASFEVMNRAWDAGINFFDTADIYTRWSDKSYSGKTEEIIGRWLKDTGNREDLILATKLRGQFTTKPNDSGLSKRHMMRQIKGSLNRLQTKWIDLYQSHSFDDQVPIKETLEGFSNLVSKGLVNAIGASNYPAWRLVEALHIAEKYNLPSYKSLQPYYSIARRHRFEPDLQEVCLQHNIAVIPYSPLSGGFLTGKYRRDQELPESDRANGVKTRFFNDRGFSILERVEELAKEKEVTIAQLSLAWNLHQPSITSPIIGANSVEQLDELLPALDIQLNQEELKRLDEVSNPETNYIIQ
ncbi:MAG: aldo/keto reductase [Candidatus Heimdallarchaeota archaeon]|nr:aldo/keto reductase [Candidatus Heimdallarchaeota archaeon]MDH5646167.1 aldo/keto reductase [Candidatus Heimdallarchaeota archaeon]